MNCKVCTNPSCNCLCSTCEGARTVRQHVRKQCTDKECNGTCMLDELFICEVCGGMEGSLLPECPGHKLTMEEDQKNYQHYLNGTGPFASKKEE